MLTSRNFWFGVVAGVGVVYAYNRFARRGSANG